jgi:hypothetical protein
MRVLRFHDMETIDTHGFDSENPWKSYGSKVTSRAFQIGEESTMTKPNILRSVYENFAEAVLPDALDEWNADLLAPFSGSATTDSDEYAQVQREFGWDDTH